MNTKSKATVATLGLGALVLSGGTLALWQDQATVSSAKISTGHLAVAVDSQTAYDISDLKLQSTKTFTSSADKQVDLASYSAVPGDSIRIVQPVTVDLEGDNLAAELGIVSASGATVAMADQTDDDDAVYDDWDGTEELTVSGAKLVEGANVAAAAADTAKAVDKTASGAYRFTANDDDKTFYAVYDVTFNWNDQVGGEADSAAMEAVATVTGLDATLTQVRS